MTIRLLIADDHPLVRAGLTSMCAGTEIEVCKQASNSETAAKYALSSDIDVALLDVRLPTEGGFAVLDRIRRERPSLPVLMYSASQSITEVYQARNSGAKGYVLKTASRDELLQAIRKVGEGREAWTRQQLRRVSNTACEYEPVLTDTAALTPREQEVLRKIAEGMINDDIARQLEINVETVKHHITHILEKLGLEHRTQAAVWAVRHGMVG